MASGVKRGEMEHTAWAGPSIHFPGRICGLRYTAERSRERGWLNIQLAMEARERRWKLDVRVTREQIERRKALESSRKYGSTRPKRWKSAPPPRWGWCHRHGCTLDYASSVGCDRKGYAYDCERCRDEQIAFGGEMRILWLWYTGRIPLPPDVAARGEARERGIAERVRYYA